MKRIRSLLHFEGCRANSSSNSSYAERSLLADNDVAAAVAAVVAAVVAAIAAVSAIAAAAVVAVSAVSAVAAVAAATVAAVAAAVAAVFFTCRSGEYQVGPLLTTTTPPPMTMSTTISSDGSDKSMKSSKDKTVDGVSWKCPKYKNDQDSTTEIILVSSSSDSTPLNRPTSCKDVIDDHTRTARPTSAAIHLNL